MRIAVIANTSWYLYNFRLNLMRTLTAAGHEVVAVGPPDDYVGKLVSAGVRHRTVPLSGASVNPLRELRTVWALHRLFRDEDVDVVLSYTPKGNIYAAMAAAMNGLPTVPNVSGLGRVFIRRSPLTWLVRQLYRFAFARAVRVFFQNRDDLELFVRMGLVDAGKVKRLPGSGVDLARFEMQEARGRMRGAGAFRFLLIARMLWDKGVGEYVEAARRVRKRFPQAEFCLLGFLDVQNPAAIRRKEMDAWIDEGVVNYLGAVDDVRPHIAAADCVVLPSYYREGTPRTLLEAAAMGRPIITTDAVGCRDVVEDGANGFLVRPRDAADLAEKMERMMNLTGEERAEMGRLGREKMAREFDERIVIKHYLEVLEGRP